MIAGIIKTVRPVRRGQVIVTAMWMTGLPVPEKSPRRLEHVLVGAPTEVLGVWVLKSVNEDTEETTLWRERGEAQPRVGDMLQWRVSSGHIPSWGNSSKPPPP